VIILNDGLFDNLVPAGLFNQWGGGLPIPAVALRSTAGYAHHAPCGAKKNIL
jgi:hypothetical protein